MIRGAYYNEIDPYAAQWLRNLIKAGHIAPGDVDERSIADVRPDDLRGYQQAHFFAGIGGWSYGLRLAGWADDRPVWTGSCPCQPFSAAGKQEGVADKRHLWPAWFELIRECRPSVIFGEQVSGAIKHGWLDLVFSDLEKEDYTCGASVLPACSVGAPHIRQRLWFVADAGYDERPAWASWGKHKPEASISEWAGSDFANGELADADGGNASTEGLQRGGEQRQLAQDGRVVRLGNAARERRQSGLQTKERQEPSDASATCSVGYTGQSGLSPRECQELPGAEQFDRGRAAEQSGCSPWACEWLPCTDGKARPVEPGAFPLAHGVPNRVGRLRAYGNAIVPQVAAEFIRATGLT